MLSFKFLLKLASYSMSAITNASDWSQVTFFSSPRSEVSDCSCSCFAGRVQGGRGAHQLQMTLRICSRQLRACFVTLTRNKLQLSQEIKHLLSTLVYAQRKSKTVIITMEFLKGLPMLHFQICQHFATKQITSSMAWTTKHEDSSQRNSIN